MKRLFSIAAAIAFVGVSAFAADNASAPAMHFGVHGGVDFMNQTVSASVGGVSANVTASSATGFLAGALAEFPLTDMFALQPEVNFVQKGSSNGASQATITRLNYIEVPVWAKAKFNLGGIKPFVMTGPSIGFLLSANSNPPGGAASTDIKSNLNTIDFGWQFGAGAAFAVTDSMDVFVDARYDLGLTNIAKSTGQLANASYKNHGIMITAGLMF